MYITLLYVCMYRYYTKIYCTNVLCIGTIGTYLFLVFYNKFQPRIDKKNAITFYWKELRSCDTAQNFRLLPAQLIGYLTFFFFVNFLFNFSGVIFFNVKIIKS
jgi:hypothetical protein